MRKFLLAVGTIAGAAVLASGCAGGVERIDGAAAPVVAPTTSTATTPPATTAPATTPPATKPAPTTGAAKTPASPPRATKTTCPVTNAELQQALRARPNDGVFPDSTFTKIVCYQNYAATTVPERSNSDESYVVFQHSSGSWSVLTSGTADICPGVPADVIRHFRSARYGACS